MKPSSSTTSSGVFSEWMDFFRWTAAFTVVISHVGGPLLVSLSSQSPDQRPLLQYIYSFVAGFAHPAVIIFFVLSGYFVGGLYSLASSKYGPRPADYLLKRFVRLWIVLIPTLILSYILAYFGNEISPIVYASRKTNTLDAFTFTCNALFLQTTICGLYASNDSLWSIFHEFWYYILFLIALTSLQTKNLLVKLALIALFVTVLTTLGLIQTSNAPIGPYFFIWLFGVYAARTSAPKILSSPIYAIFVFSACLVSLRILLGPDRMHGTTIISFVTDLLIGLLFAKLMINIKHASRFHRPPLGSFNSRLADFSYSLYCTHLPIALFYSAVVYAITGLGFEMIPNTGEKWLVTVGCIFCTILFSYVFHLCFEKHTPLIREKFSSLVTTNLSRR